MIWPFSKAKNRAKPELHAAKEMLKAASAAGFTIEISNLYGTEYKGSDPADAWEAVVASEEMAQAQLYDANGQPVKGGYALLLVDGPTVRPLNTIAKYPSEGWVLQWWTNRFSILGG